MPKPTMWPLEFLCGRVNDPSHVLKVVVERVDGIVFVRGWYVGALCEGVMYYKGGLPTIGAFDIVFNSGGLNWVYV
jgi:hypothetical protein